MDIVKSRRIFVAPTDMSKLSQETLTIIGATIALAALILTSTAGVRGEIQAVRDELRDVRAEARTERHAISRRSACRPRNDARRPRDVPEPHPPADRAAGHPPSSPRWSLRPAPASNR